MHTFVFIGRIGLQVFLLPGANIKQVLNEFYISQLWISPKRLFINCEVSRNCWVLAGLVELRRPDASGVN